jgi:hypothetical protein
LYKKNITKINELLRISMFNRFFYVILYNFLKELGDFLKALSDFLKALGDFLKAFGLFLCRFVVIVVCSFTF